MYHYDYNSARRCGFTLVELSIVLVIIGLLVGGVFIGRDLIDTAAARSQVTQIDKYYSAVNLFQSKYGYLPGDIPDPTASHFGFVGRGSCANGQGDGNGLLQGQTTCGTYGIYNAGTVAGEGELAIFWVDLSYANLLDTTFYPYDVKGTNYPSTNHRPNQIITLSTTPSIYQWLPQAKIGNGNFVYVFSWNQLNWFGVSAITELRDGYRSASNPGITVQQASNIDNKMDDGLPLTGSVTVCYLSQNIYSQQELWAAGGGLAGTDGGWANYVSHCSYPTATAIPYASTNCYDNNNSSSTTPTYSISKNAIAQNCALSFQFQN